MGAAKLTSLFVDSEGPNQCHDPADDGLSQQYVDQDGAEHVLLASGQHDDGRQEVQGQARQAKREEKSRGPWGINVPVHVWNSHHAAGEKQGSRGNK
jgi:hypothetical protein